MYNLFFTQNTSYYQSQRFLLQDRLIVSNVTATSCQLSWGASRNTGGLPLDYLVERLAVADGSWVKQAATSATHITVNDLGICQ